MSTTCPWCSQRLAAAHAGDAKKRWREGRLDLPWLAEIVPKRCNMTIDSVKIDSSDGSVQLGWIAGFGGLKRLCKNKLQRHIGHGCCLLLHCSSLQHDAAQPAAWRSVALASFFEPRQLPTS
ncbi:hypothetical protein PMIN07_000455 [Paraphaeosphaeria minitans]